MIGKIVKVKIKSFFSTTTDLTPFYGGVSQRRRKSIENNQSPKNPRVVPRPIFPVLGQSLEKALCDQPLNIALSNVKLTIFGQIDHPMQQRVSQ